MRDRFRIDARMFADDKQLAELTVHGPTLEAAIASITVLLAPHIATGALIEIEQTGVFCDTCQGYHPATKRLEMMHSDESHGSKTLFEGSGAN